MLFSRISARALRMPLPLRQSASEQIKATIAHARAARYAFRRILDWSNLGPTQRHRAFPLIHRSPPLVLGAYPLVHSVPVLVLFVTFSWLTFLSHSINLENVYTFPSRFVSI